MMDMTAGERRHAFAIWIRTGRLPTVSDDGVERKFNPYHDPRNGRFTFAPGGPQALSRVVISRRRTPYVRPKEPGATEKRSQPGGAVAGLAVEQLRNARLIRAAAAMKFQGDLGPMQIETVRLMQKEADEAYERCLPLLESGKLKVHISRELTRGNYVDGEVRRAIRCRFRNLGIRSNGAGPVRVNRREHDTGSDETTYRAPDARVGNIAYDVTVSKKDHKTPQAKGFFQS